MHESFLKNWKSIGILFMGLSNIFVKDNITDEDITNWINEIKIIDKTKDRLIIDSHKFLKDNIKEEVVNDSV